jgi:hypothetical protein
MLNWYDSALYFLNKADFLRHHDIRSVQAIAILGIVFNNVGDSKLHNTLWACAIRIAQSLGMGNDRAYQNESLLHAQIRCRLWWTLILCEWIPIPYHTPSIVEGDFQVEIPASLDDDELQSTITKSDSLPRPIQYHIAMIHLAIVYHRFRVSLKHTSSNPAEIGALVLNTDDALADIVEGLPSHLQGNQDSEMDPSCHPEYSWISWQKTNLSLILLVSP